MKKPDHPDDLVGTPGTPIMAEGPITRIDLVPGGMGRVTVGPLGLDVQTSLVSELQQTLTRGLEKLAAQQSAGCGPHAGECSDGGPVN
jgi:hypothetical protein